jgi:inosose dehydratase
MIIGTNGFRWSQHYNALGRKPVDYFDEALHAAARAGIQTWEALGLADDAEAAALARALQSSGLRAHTLYVNCRLHEPDWRVAIERTLSEARRGIALGVRVICSNPEPVQWGGPQDKTDDALKRQLEAIRLLTERMRAEGAELAYHVHDAELRNGAREMHHMLINTEDIGMGFGFDPHWVYRGCGNSQIAVDDVLKLYGHRINLLHIRQSVNGTWTETLQDGDVDFRPLFTLLKQRGYAGVINVELGFEPGVPETLGMEESHRRSVAWLTTQWANA